MWPDVMQRGTCDFQNGFPEFLGTQDEISQQGLKSKNTG